MRKKTQQKDKKYEYVYNEKTKKKKRTQFVSILTT